jgi:predicted neutral ceramidase superfamily lipid hydrolase
MSDFIMQSTLLIQRLISILILMLVRIQVLHVFVSVVASSSIPYM